MNNSLSAWEPILIRVLGLDRFRSVEPMPRLFAANDLTVFPSPCCFIGYGGDQMDPRAGFGAVVQFWDAWIIDRNSRDARSNIDSCLSIGEHLDAVIESLTGFEPSEEHSRLERLTPVEAVQYYPGGVVIYPLRFRSVYVRNNEVA